MTAGAAGSGDLPDLEVRDVVKRFGSFTAVDQVSLSVPSGSFFSILGPSGCGKTSLMRMIAGFSDPDAGTIVIKGQDVAGIPANRRPANMVFQHLALFPMMTVARNIGYGLRRRGLGAGEIATKVNEMLERVGLPDAGPKRIDQLSGGQKQRIAIARCLVLEPALLLLDEPLGALDLKLREQMKVELKLLQATLGTTFVYITHDQSEALVMSDQVAVMNKGRFEQVGTPQDLYYRPASAFVAGFVGNSNSWSGVVETSGDQVAVRLADGRAIVVDPAVRGSVANGDGVSVYVRPESIGLTREPIAGNGANVQAGRVESLLFDGGNSQVLVEPAEGGEAGRSIVVALPQTGELADLRPGETVHLAWTAANTRCFISETQ